MAVKTMLNFRCPSELLEAIDNLGKERHPSNASHGCDRSKTLMDIMRAGIEALSDGAVVLPAVSDIKQSSDNLEERITEAVERKTQGLATAIEQLRAELGEFAA